MSEVDVNPLHSAVQPSWETPQEWIEAARGIMGSIDLDPASCLRANQRVQAKNYFTAKENGLLQEWNSPNVFLNPPGRLWKEFLYKLHEELNEGRVQQCFYLGFSLEQLRKISPQEWDFAGRLVTLAVPHKRIRFLDPTTGLRGKSPTHGNVFLLVLRPENAPNIKLHLGNSCNVWEGYGG